MPHPAFTDAEKATIVILHRQGARLEDIAAALPGRTPSGVRGVVAKLVRKGVLPSRQVRKAAAA